MRRHRIRPAHGRGSYEERALRVAMLLTLAAWIVTGLAIWRFA